MKNTFRAIVRNLGISCKQRQHKIRLLSRAISSSTKNQKHEMSRKIFIREYFSIDAIPVNIAITKAIRNNNSMTETQFFYIMSTILRTNKRYPFNINDNKIRDSHQSR